jgi:hypothetical protein
VPGWSIHDCDKPNVRKSGWEPYGVHKMLKTLLKTSSAELACTFQSHWKFPPIRYSLFPDRTENVL